MAKGDLRVFNHVPGWLALGGAGSGLDFQSSGSWRVALVSVGVDSIADTENTPRLNQGNLTEVSTGGNYSSPGQIITTIASADTDDDGTFTFKLDTDTHTGGLISWSQNASNPTNARTAVIQDNGASFVTRPCICYIDLTDDGGTTAVDMTGTDLQITFGTGGNTGEIMKFTVNN